MARRRRSFALALIAGLALAACNRTAGNPAPPRVETPAELPRQTSTIVVPIAMRIAELEAGLNARTPRQLWSIDRQEKKCIPAQRVKVLGIRAKVTPDIGCRIVGQVTRGRIRLSGRGGTLTVTMPVNAVVSARDVGGVIKQETATGAAAVRATVRLSLDRAWRPVAKVDIAYDWTNPPGIDFLGQRIRFVDKADAKLKGVIAGLERDLPREMAKADVRGKLEGLWRQAFAVIELNERKPPAWMRVTPERLGYGGYRVSGDRIELTLAAEAITETFIGDAPARPTPTPLPPPGVSARAPGLRFFIPVVADYAQLQPVVQRALLKRAARGITLPKIGPVDAEFGDVTVYATEGGRLAVGIAAKVKARGHGWGSTHGVVWLSAVPYNEADTQLVRVRDLRIAGETDSAAVNLLFALFADDALLTDIREALVHDFNSDYARVLAAARKAVASRREGDFLLSATIDKVHNGEIKVTGQGLFLPVRAEGAARISYSPRKR